MRLHRLQLTRFGHFSDFKLDLDGAGFHVILGRNEAGKSTLVEAWLNLLYGIPTRTSYAFLHPRDTLEIRAVVDDGAGEVALTRTPQRSNNLLDADGAPVPPAVLEAMLRGVPEDAYRALYCLNDDTIEKGGDDILASKGDLGQLLFAAASGMEAFNADLEAERRADRDFQRRGPGRQSTEVFALKKQLAELKAARDEIDVTAPDYRRLRDEAADAASADEAARARHEELARHEQDLRARLAALPLKTDLDERAAELAELGDLPEIGEDAKAEMTRLAVERTAHQSTLRARRADLVRLAADRDSIVVEEAALNLRGQLADLAGMRSRAAADAEDLPRRRDEAQTLRGRVARRLTELGLAKMDPGKVLLPRPALEALDRAVRARDLARRDLVQAREEHERASLALAAARQEAETIGGDSTDPGSLRDLLEDRGAGRLANDLKEAVRAHTSAAEAALAAREALAIGTVAFDACPDVPLTPDAATALAQDLQQGEAAVAQLCERLAEDRALIDQLAARYRTRAAQGQDVSDAAAGAARTRRDALWRAHRDALNPETADAFADALSEDDALTALRLADGARLADLRQVGVTLAETEATHDARARDLAVAENNLAAARARLADYLDVIGLPGTLGAQALADWLKDHARAAASERAEHLAADALATARRRAAPVLEGLRDALGGGAPDDPLTLVQAAKDRLSGIMSAHRDREAKLRAIQAAEQNLTARTESVAMAAEKLEGAETALDEASSALDLALPSNLDLADAMQVLREVAADCAELANLSDRIAKMEQNRATFGEAVGRVATPWPDLSGETPIAKAAGLDRILAEAEKDLDRRARRNEEIARVRDQIADAERELDAIEKKAARLAQAFPAPPEGFDAIREAVSRASTAAKLRGEIGTIGARLVGQLGVKTAAEAEERLREQTVPDLQARLDLLALDLEAAKTAREDTMRARMSAENALAQVGGEDDAALLAQERQTVLEDLRTRTEAGLTRRLALMLAERALARYRDRHRSAMLADTAEAFADLTSGAYPALSTQATDKGDVLIARRASDGRSLRADEASMSKGTRFQLYLALRLAGYRQMANSGIVLPFVCDDVFETFDEARTAAACRLMHRIGGIGQALYFTHHAHVAEIARTECGGEVVVHTI